VFSEWRKWAACRGVPELFFSYDEERVAHARAICDGCPVRQECLQTALADRRLYGVWGGTTEAQREAIRRRRVG
jgi:WhiB family transcriptional regulator, redox-sensing transcriptional regulator